MKKSIPISLLAIILFFLTQSAAFAQHAQTKVGLGVLYGDEPETVGIQFTATYRISPKVALAPDVSIYFPDKDNIVDTGRALDGFFAINLNGHYLFTAEKDYHIYGIGGLNIAHANYTFADDDTKLGINVGIGGEYHLQGFSLFGELKYVISDLDQVVVGAGARVPIN